MHRNALPLSLLGVGSSDKHAVIRVKVLKTQVDLKPADKSEAAGKAK